MRHATHPKSLTGLKKCCSEWNKHAAKSEEGGQYLFIHFHSVTHHLYIHLYKNDDSSISFNTTYRVLYCIMPYCFLIKNQIVVQTVLWTAYVATSKSIKFFDLHIRSVLDHDFNRCAFLQIQRKYLFSFTSSQTYVAVFIIYNDDDYNDDNGIT